MSGAQKATPARGRPRSFDPEAALDKARSVFWVRGYAAASLDEIAAATGLNRPSLYAAFGRKHELYVAALERSRREFIDGLERALSVEVPLRRALAAVFDAAIAWDMSGETAPRGCFLIGAALAEAVDHQQVGRLLARFVAETEALFRARFEGEPSQLAPGLKPEAAAVMATAILHEVAIRARAGIDNRQLGRICDIATGMICGPGPL